MLGITGFEAKYIKRFGDVRSIMQSAIESFVREVKNKQFPTEEQGY
jgi:ketopantoate hydroxymethyltransferase